MMLVQQMSQPPEPAPSLPPSQPSILQLPRSRRTTQTQQTPPINSLSVAPARKTNSVATPRPKQSFTIRPATIADAEQICQLGSTVFADTFGFSIPPADLATYLATSYALSAIESELSSPDHHFHVACDVTDPSKILGFAQMTEHTTEPCLAHLPQDSLVELQRLYVLPETHGRGVGKALTRGMQTLAREKGYRYLWLGVWEGNFIAQSVYEKSGFSRVGDHEFTMGRCVQIDWIMVKEVS